MRGGGDELGPLEVGLDLRGRKRRQQDMTERALMGRDSESDPDVDADQTTRLDAGDVDHLVASSTNAIEVSWISLVSSARWG
ncbi:hypothetical protein BJF78_36355 [Pseudonocardia sp. CNS-139]|nr:hypothetical protein BJF78_36355 [Pseudonocardia sp. CNS-139]